MQTGTVSRLWLRRRSWRFEIHFWRNIVRFWKSNICSNKLDVQETNCCFSQFNRIWNHLFGHWTEIGWFACSGLWDLIVSVFGYISPWSNPEFPQEQWKIFTSSEAMNISTWSYDMEGHAKKVCGRYFELAFLNYSTTFESINSMHWWPSLQRKIIEILERIARRMYTDCPEMSIFGTHW